MYWDFSPRQSLVRVTDLTESHGQIPLPIQYLKHSIYLVLVIATVSGCTRTVQAWPPPIVPGSEVRVRFAAPRVVVFEGGRVKDSVAGVRELRGRVFALHNDTLVLSVASKQSRNASEAGVDQLATIALDQSTSVTTSEVDGWKFAYALLAGCVLIFAAAVLSGS